MTSVSASSERSVACTTARKTLSSVGGEQLADDVVRPVPVGVVGEQLHARHAQLGHLQHVAKHTHTNRVVEREGGEPLRRVRVARCEQVLAERLR